MDGLAIQLYTSSLAILEVINQQNRCTLLFCPIRTLNVWWQVLLSLSNMSASFYISLSCPQPFHFHSVFRRVCRLEQEKSALQKKLKARGVTADQVVGVRSTQMEKEIEELKKKNSDLETQIITIK